MVDVRERRELSQYFTPTWAAELLFGRFFPDADANDLVLDPSCGDGRMLMAIPGDVPAIGIEIDSLACERARVNTGRQIINSDFTIAELPGKPTLIFGNPPYQADLIDAFLDRAHAIMDEGGRVGFLLPCYIFQTPSRVLRYNERWSLSQTMIPRTLFERLEKPLMFAEFIKDRRRIMSGLFLYSELDAVQRMHKEFRAIFIGNESRASVWGEAVELALLHLGGSGTLQEIYRIIEGNRPTTNKFWQEKVRQVLQLHFRRIGPARYSLHGAAA